MPSKVAKSAQFLSTLALTSALSISLFASPAFADRKQDFANHLKTLEQEMQQEGINPQLFRTAVGDDFSIDEKAITKLQNQPESVMTFEKYTSSMLSDARIKKGRELYAQHKDKLEEISAKSGVSPEIIVALWGIESYFGKWAGRHSIARSLATLTFDSHRKDFFKRELFAAMRILQEGHIEPTELKGSWAGAMGQCQFMPTSFLAYAADGDGDGKKNIWTNEADVFASAANYLKTHGWKTNQAWGQRVVLSKILPPLKLSERGLTGRKSVAEWKKIGIVAAKGGFKVADTEKARLYIPNGPSQTAYLVYNNFDTVLDWNRSSYFAFSANALADAIAQRDGGML